MAFTLDKTQGKGKATVKVTPEVNQTGNKVTGQILVQVNGVTKQVVQLVQRAAVSELEMHLTIDNPYISGEGGTATFSYWAVENGAIVGDNLELVFESNESANVEFQLGPASKDSSGKITQSITLPANNINEVKELKFHVRHVITDSVSNTLVVSLLGKDMTVLPKFDFFCFSYGWSEDGGMDLDSATLVAGSKIPIGSRTLDDYFVGYGGNGNTDGGVQQYLKWGGDNTESGAEGAFINWREICNRDLISQGITKLYAYIYGNWFHTKGNGDMTFYFRTYKGTGMVQDGHEFKPNADTQLITETSKVINCHAFSQANSPGGSLENMKKWYSLLATVEYDVATSNAAFKPNLKKSGRSVTGSVIFDGETINFNNYGAAVKTINLPKSPVGTYSHNWSDAKEVIDTSYPVPGSITDLFIEGDPMVSMEWMKFNFIKDGNGYVTGMTYQVFPNNTGSERYGSMRLLFKPSIRNTGADILTLTFIQAG